MSDARSPDIKRVSERVAYEGKIFTVLEREMLVRGRLETWEVLRARDVVRVVPVDSSGNFVLMEEERPELERSQIRVVSGGIEQDQTAEEAAQAELSEELGMTTASPLVHLGSCRPVNKIDSTTYGFLAYGVTIVGSPETQVRPISVSSEKAVALALCSENVDESARLWIIRAALRGGVNRETLAHLVDQSTREHGT